MTRAREKKTRTLAGALAFAPLLALAGLAAAAEPEPPTTSTGPAVAEEAAEEAAEKVPPIPRRVEEVVVQAVRADADTPVTKTDVPRAEIERKNLGQDVPALLDGDIREEQNRDELNPLDGRVIEACDKLAAYIEASHSIRLGLAPQALADGKRNLYSRFGRSVISGFPMGQLFDYFW